MFLHSNFKILNNSNTTQFLFQQSSNLQNIDELLDNESELSSKLCQIGDSIVYKLVQWTKRLPFYAELPVEVHTKLLTQKWHELLVLTTSSYQAINGSNRLASTSSDGTEAHFSQEVCPPDILRRSQFNTVD